MCVNSLVTGILEQSVTYELYESFIPYLTISFHPFTVIYMIYVLFMLH